jgi:hypothetical protein
VLASRSDATVPFSGGHLARSLAQRLWNAATSFYRSGVWSAKPTATPWVCTSAVASRPNR